MSDTPTNISLSAPRSCSNCDAEDGIRWHVQGFHSRVQLGSNQGRPRVSAFLGCDSCGETIQLIEYAEDLLESMINVATSDPVAAMKAAWDAIVPHVRTNVLADMGRDDEVDRGPLRELLATLEPVDLLCISVVATELAAEANKARDAKLMAEIGEARGDDAP